MQRFTGLLGVIIILSFCWFVSKSRKNIKPRIIIVGLILQTLFALFIIKLPWGTALFEKIGRKVAHLIEIPAKAGSQFVFGFLSNADVLTEKIGAPYSYIFFFNIMATLIFIGLLVNIGYYFGIIQRVVVLIAKGINYLIPVSGSEALSNVATAFIGQIEAQILIKSYLKGMTISELFTSMSGSFACLSGSIMIIYINLGINPAYIMASSIMAIPGSILVSKILMPETEISETRGNVKLSIQRTHVNLIDSITNGCLDGLKIALNIFGVLIGFIALIKFINMGLGALGNTFSYPNLTLNYIFSWIFKPLVFIMGVPTQDIQTVSGLLGTKLVVNEFIAFVDLKTIIALKSLHPKTIAIITIALCSFANFGSLGIQIAGIGGLEPSRRKDIVKIGLKALLCGSLVSYLNACIVGIIF